MQCRVWLTNAACVGQVAQPGCAGCCRVLLLQALQEKHGSGEDLPELAKQELAAMMLQR